MRPSNKSRSRHKSGGNNQRRHAGNVINRVFDSAGPDGKVRGTPQQIIDKYNVLARDAQLSGDRVAAESFLQHSEHYSRLLGEAQRQQTEQRQAQQQAERGGNQQNQRREESAQPDTEPTGKPAPDMASGSGLATIDAPSTADRSGPIDTPENKNSGDVLPLPVSEEPAPPAANAVDKAEGDVSPKPAPKRTRTRRKSRPADASGEPSASAEQG